MPPALDGSYTLHRERVEMKPTSCAGRGQVAVRAAARGGGGEAGVSCGLCPDCSYWLWTLLIQ